MEGIQDRGEEPPKLSRRRKILKDKEERKKQPKEMAAAARRDKAKDDKAIDPFAPCPVNVCNLCGLILNSEHAKLEHIQSSAHPKCDKFCTYPNCGCVYNCENHLKLHKSLHDH